MKKSCQLYNLLFCKEDDVMGCTINVAILFYCTKMERHFGALRFGQLTG
ncbi:reductase [Enterobacter sp. 63]